MGPHQIHINSSGMAFKIDLLLKRSSNSSSTQFSFDFFSHTHKVYSSEISPKTAIILWTFNRISFWTFVKWWWSVCASYLSTTHRKTTHIHKPAAHATTLNISIVNRKWYFIYQPLKWKVSPFKCIIKSA